MSLSNIFIIGRQKKCQYSKKISAKNGTGMGVDVFSVKAEGLI